MPDLTNLVPVKIRFDPHHIVTIEEAPITQKNALGVDVVVRTYAAWSIKRVSAGTCDTDLVQRKDGSRGKAFNFSGKLSTLPELHLALYKLDRDCVEPKLPPLAELLEVGLDEFGCKDISCYTQRSYPTEAYRFGDITVSVGDAPFRNNAGEKSTYVALTLRKRKSEKVRNSDHTFYSLRCL